MMVLAISWDTVVLVICLGIPSWSFKVLGPLDVNAGSTQFSVWSAWVLANGAKTLVLESACASLEEGEWTPKSGSSSRWLHAKTVTDFGSGSRRRINCMKMKLGADL